MGSDEGVQSPQCQSPHGDDKDDSDHASRVCVFAPALEHCNQSNHKQQDGAGCNNF